MVYCVMKNSRACGSVFNETSIEYVVDRVWRKNGASAVHIKDIFAVGTKKLLVSYFQSISKSILPVASCEERKEQERDDKFVSA